MVSRHLSVHRFPFREMHDYVLLWPEAGNPVQEVRTAFHLSARSHALRDYDDSVPGAFLEACRGGQLIAETFTKCWLRERRTAWGASVRMTLKL